ncbi:hypothetical protein RRG08_039647 [Elysia crispata]|uniref:Uncharacterized protein n=1 Tax=Elysia crispata TaxID=231223 RepID=A0AAE1CUX3_9GAST|nr:hypothetical protein RRG08_039647 [Elysia crispata]
MNVINHSGLSELSGGHGDKSGREEREGGGVHQNRKSEVLQFGRNELSQNHHANLRRRTYLASTVCFSCVSLCVRQCVRLCVVRAQIDHHAVLVINTGQCKNIRDETNTTEILTMMCEDVRVRSLTESPGGIPPKESDVSLARRNDSSRNVGDVTKESPLTLLVSLAFARDQTRIKCRSSTMTVVGREGGGCANTGRSRPFQRIFSVGEGVRPAVRYCASRVACGTSCQLSDRS